MPKIIKKPSLEDLDEGVKVMLGRTDVFAAELMDFIEQKLENIPKKSAKIYKIWKKEVNLLIDKINVEYGKRYNRVV